MDITYHNYSGTTTSYNFEKTYYTGGLTGGQLKIPTPGVNGSNNHQPFVFKASFDPNIYLNNSTQKIVLYRINTNIS